MTLHVFRRDLHINIEKNWPMHKSKSCIQYWLKLTIAVDYAIYYTQEKISDTKPTMKVENNVRRAQYVKHKPSTISFIYRYCHNKCMLHWFLERSNFWLQGSQQSHQPYYMRKPNVHIVWPQPQRTKTRLVTPMVNAMHWCTNSFGFDPAVQRLVAGGGLSGRHSAER